MPRKGQDDDVSVTPLRAVQESTGIDPWQLEDANYSRANFYTRSVDSRGHKETFHVPSPPAIFGQVGELVASRMIPAYRSPQDFVRDAIVHRLRDVAEMTASGQLARVISLEVIRCQQEQMLVEMEEFEKVLVTSEQVMEQAAKLEDVGMLDQAITYSKEQAESIRDPYRSRLLVTVQKHEETLKRIKKS